MQKYKRKNIGIEFIIEAIQVTPSNRDKIVKLFKHRVRLNDVGVPRMSIDISHFDSGSDRRPLPMNDYILRYLGTGALGVPLKEADFDECFEASYEKLQEEK